MYPLLRFADVMIRGRWRSALGPDDSSELRMTVWPWDCDMFIEMNNGRHLTLFDLGRFDFGIRCGLMRILKREKWGLVVAGATIRYRKRLTPFQRYTLRTRLIGRDDRWFYFVQTTLRNGEACSSALMRTGVTRGGRVIPTQDVADALDMPDWNPALPDWVAGWVSGDALRPWPPDD